jgi:hypothetical protein
MAELLRGPNGPVTRRLIEDAELVKVRAKEECPVYAPPDAYTAANRKRRPGTLRDSIVKRIVQSGTGVTALVGSDDPVSLWVHEGTVPHTITARNKPMLVFYWPNGPDGARVYRMRSVSHPGSPPNRFLIRALAVLRGRY